jgi:hypothetical protein
LYPSSFEAEKLFFEETGGGLPPTDYIKYIEKKKHKGVLIYMNEPKERKEIETSQKYQYKLSSH